MLCQSLRPVQTGRLHFRATINEARVLIPQTASVFQSYTGGPQPRARPRPRARRPYLVLVSFFFIVALMLSIVVIIHDFRTEFRNNEVSGPFGQGLSMPLPQPGYCRPTILGLSLSFHVLDYHPLYRAPYGPRGFQVVLGEGGGVRLAPALAPGLLREARRLGRSCWLLTEVVSEPASITRTVIRPQKASNMPARGPPTMTV